MAKLIETTEINEGYAPAHQLDNWDFPLHSEILPGLWVGGTDDLDTIEESVNLHAPKAITKKDFDAVVTLYAWANPVDWMVEELRFGFYDSGIDHIDSHSLATAVSFALGKWQAGKKVLIRCQAGLNRSGLTAALVLIEAGYTPDEAINLLRTKRSEYVLCNGEFEAFVRTLDKKNE
jgi:rhodanese-related sulfurtransferase